MNMELSCVKTERRRMTMVSLEALQFLSSGETSLSVASSGGCAKRFRSSRRVTRVILMAQILTRVQIPASLSRA